MTFAELWADYLWPLLIIVIQSVAMLVILLVSIAYILLADRKIWAAVQIRRGPNVVGPWGLFQSFADLLKFVLKEPIIPAAAAAEDRLDGDWQAVLPGEGDDLVGVLDRILGAGGEGGIGAFRDVLGLGLVAQCVDGLGGGADPDQAGVEDRLGEVGVLGEKAIARVHAVGTAPLGDGEDLLHRQVRVGRR